MHTFCQFFCFISDKLWLKTLEIQYILQATFVFDVLNS